MKNASRRQLECIAAQLNEAQRHPIKIINAANAEKTNSTKVKMIANAGLLTPAAQKFHKTKWQTSPAGHLKMRRLAFESATAAAAATLPAAAIETFQKINPQLNAEEAALELAHQMGTANLDWQNI
jgi:hypothetical protein